MLLWSHFALAINVSSTGSATVSVIFLPLPLSCMKYGTSVRNQHEWVMNRNGVALNHPDSTFHSMDSFAETSVGKDAACWSVYMDSSSGRAILLN